VKSTRDAPWRLDAEIGGNLRSFVLRLASPGFEKEFHILSAMEAIAIPTPRVYGWDPDGDTFGVACFFMDYVHGESLRKVVLAGDEWAERLFIDSVCGLQMVTREQLTAVTEWLGKDETACSVLANAYAFLRSLPLDAIVDEAYAQLTVTKPDLPETRFSNGDLWLDNFIVRNRELAGVIDFANAGFSDPIYEFLLSPFLNPVLRERGLEERYCQKLGVDPGVLRWYHGLEYFDSWHWVLKTGQPYEQHTAEDLRAGLERWLDGE
jgi:aminoglycoside phosphotransferase (APT) family kinase protein